MQMDYSPYNPVASFEEGALENYLSVEDLFTPAEVNVDSNKAILRKKAIHVILENSKCDNFDAFIPYLAMNYFDRYISRNPLPNVVGSVREEIVLVANCCLMLAWKTRQSTFKVLEFLVKTNMIEHQRHILPVELAILNGLNWRMRAVTAICFVDMFVRQFPMAKKIRPRTMNQIIIQLQGDITFTKFKPSVLAAAALLTACKIKYNDLYNDCLTFILNSKLVNEDNLKACEEKTYQVCIDKRIIMERDEQGPQGQGNSQAGKSSSCISGKEMVHATSEIQDIDNDRELEHAPGKEPVPEISEIKEELVMASESKNDPEMNFELKWMLWNTDAVEITIDSPLSRSVTAADETSFIESNELDVTFTSLQSLSPTSSSPTTSTETVERNIMERDEQGPQVEGNSEAGESSSSISHRPGKEPVHASSEIQEIDDNIKHRPGKEPITEIKEEVKSNDTEMNFELKCMLWSTDAVEITIDSPISRSVTAADEKSSVESNELDMTFRSLQSVSPTSSSPTTSTETVEEDIVEEAEWFIPAKEMYRLKYFRKLKKRKRRSYFVFSYDNALPSCFHCN